MEVRTMTSKIISGSLSVADIQITGVFLLRAEELLNLVANFSVRNLDIILGSAVIRHEREEVIVGDIQLMSCQ